MEEDKSNDFPTLVGPIRVHLPAPSLGNEKNYREGATGGKTAAPVTANIYRRIFPILGITKSNNLGPELLVDNKGELNFVSY